jgi:YD repeat-containing protein
MKPQRWLVLAFTLIASVVVLHPLRAEAQSYLYATGNPNFGINYPIPKGFINMANGNAHITIPLGKFQQRGKLPPLEIDLVYDSRIWQIFKDSSGNLSWQPTNVPNSMAGWRLTAGQGPGNASPSYLSLNDQFGSCGPVGEYPSYPTDEAFTNFSWTDSEGTNHIFALYIQKSLSIPCATSSSSLTESGNAIDGSGLSLTATIVNQNNGQYPDSAYVQAMTIYDGQGNEVYPQRMDPNGNTITYTYDSSGGISSVTDSSGRQVLTTTTNGSSIMYNVLKAGGGTNTFTVATEPISVSTNFNQPQSGSVKEFSGTLPAAIQSIQLPDGTSYSFLYESSTSDLQEYYGELVQMTLPTGGSLMLEYVNYLDSYTTMNRWIFGATLGYLNTNISYGGAAFSPEVLTSCPAGGVGCQESMTLNKADGTNVVYTLTLNDGAWNGQTDTYQGATDIMTVRNNYDFSNLCPSYQNNIAWTAMCNGSMYIQASSSTVTLNSSGQVAQTCYTYYLPESGKLSKVQEWDYMAAPPACTSSNSSYQPTPPPTHETDYTYYYVVNSVPLVTQENKLFNGVQFSQTAYNYDSNWLGNLMSETKGLPGQAQATTFYTYDSKGMKTSSKDPNGNTTTYAYDARDVFLSTTTYPQTNGVSHIVQSSPDSNSMAPLSKIDENGQTTSYQYHDPMGRLTQISHPDGGNTTYKYSANQIVETKTLNSNISSVVTTTLDGVGRKIQVAQSDPDGDDSVTTSYDMNGRTQCVSNPQRSTASPTDGSTCYSYDALDRPTVVTQPDGKTIRVVYSGNQAIVTDENGHQKQYTYDAFHDLTSVLEPNASGALAWPTTYTYDGAGHVTSVNQAGDGKLAARSRSFSYDSLGRMVASNIPENASTASPANLTCPGVTGTWTTCYSYDGNGNLTSKTDNRGITTTYTYDPLNRLISKTYTNDPAGTASSCYQYDQSSVSGASSGKAGNMLGRMSNEWTQAGTCPASPPSSGVLTRRSVLAYDPMGRVLNEQQCTPANCTSGAPFVPTYSYDLAGDIQSSTNGTGMVSFSNTYDAAGHLSTLTSSWNDATHPPALFSAPSYTPAGALTSATFGAGLNLNRTYDSRQRITNETDTGAAVQ